MSLRNKLLMLVGIGTIIPVLIVGVYSYLNTSAALKKGVNEKLRGEVTIPGVALRNKLQSTVFDVNHLKQASPPQQLIAIRDEKELAYPEGKTWESDPDAVAAYHNARNSAMPDKLVDLRMQQTMISQSLLTNREQYSRIVFTDQFLNRFVEVERFDDGTLNVHADVNTDSPRPEVGRISLTQGEEAFLRGIAKAPFPGSQDAELVAVSDVFSYKGHSYIIYASPLYSHELAPSQEAKIKRKLSTSPRGVMAIWVDLSGLAKDQLDKATQHGESKTQSLGLYHLKNGKYKAFVTAKDEGVSDSVFDAHIDILEKSPLKEEDLHTARVLHDDDLEVALIGVAPTPDSSLEEAWVVVEAEEKSEVFAPIKEFLWIFLMIVFGSVVITGVIAAWVIIKTVTKPLEVSTEGVAGTGGVVANTTGILVSAANETAEKADSVAAATTEVSASMESVSASSREMTVAIQEVAKSAAQAAQVARDAVNEANAANTTIKGLGESSNEIGEVIRTITSIAEQTNLLALNATIEAARAGEAGKGFAVVANEVKELAKQTGTATEEISGRIEAIQGDATNAIQAIERIMDVINKVDDISNSIAASVEEQASTVNQISQNVGSANEGAQQISNNINDVSETARATAASTLEMQQASDELNKVVEGLKGLLKGKS